MAASKAIALLLIGCAAALLGGAEARMAIACSPYVYPCNCGLCPRIVDCETKQSAECFCGRAGTTPGTYPHPTEKNKYWMCSYDAGRKIAYGVEATCPYQLVWDSVLKVCTFPDAVTQQPLLQEVKASTETPPAAAAAATTPTATTATLATDKPTKSSAATIPSTTASSSKPSTSSNPTTGSASTIPSTVPATTTIAGTSTTPAAAKTTSMPAATNTAPTTGKPDVTAAAADAKLPSKALPAEAKLQQSTTERPAQDVRPMAYKPYKPHTP